MKINCIAIRMLFAVSLIFAIIIPTVLATPTNEDIQNLYLGENVLSHIEILVNLGPRVSGGATEEAAADYITNKMQSYGLDVEIQQFPIVYFEDYGSDLSVVGGDQLNPNTMLFSPSGDFTAEIIYCGLGHPEDFPADTDGKIALIQRGELYFWEKTQNAFNAGALAAIIYNNEAGNFQGTLTFITDIPAVSISQEEGNMLLSLINEEPVTFCLKVDTFAEDRESQNVIGTLEGIDPEQGIVYIGGHYDSVSVGPGANDDASGVGAMLEAARLLSTHGHRNKATLKFIAFGSEETGLDGSYNYVDANYDVVSTMGLGMINLDMIGVGDTLLIGNIGLSDSNLVDYTREKADLMQLNWEPFTAGFNSDHTYFELAGIPTVHLHQTPDPFYHTSEDTLDKIDVIKVEENGKLATATMKDWAKNPTLRIKKSAKLEKVHVYHNTLYQEE